MVFAIGVRGRTALSGRCQRLERDAERRFRVDPRPRLVKLAKHAVALLVNGVIAVTSL